MISDKQYYLDIFKVGDTDLQKLTETALSHGGDYCDLYFENTMNQTHQLIDGEVSSGGLNIDYGVGIRVLCGEKTGYAYSESTTWKDMESAAIAASAISQGTAVTPRDTRSIGATYTAQKSNGDRLVRRLYPGRPNPAADRYPIINDWRQESPSVAVGFLGKLEQAIKSRDSRITSVICALSSQTSDYLMYNSFGEMKYETRPMTTVQAMLVAGNGSRKIQKNVSRSLRKGAEMLTDALITELAGKSPTDWTMPSRRCALKVDRCRWSWGPAHQESCCTKPWDTHLKPTSTGKASRYFPTRWATGLSRRHQYRGRRDHPRQPGIA